MRHPKQLELALPFRGGKRRGAGRPRTRPHPGLIGPGVAHIERAEFPGRHPVHVTQRVRPGAGHLRSYSRLQVIKQAMRETRPGMQVVHFSVQSNHIHLIVEADGRRALSRGMQSLAARVAIRLNRLSGRRGTVFADRYHARAMSAPRDVANTIRYVLGNYRKHARETLAWSWRDPFASSIEEPLNPPLVWLLSVGWQKSQGP